MERGRVVRQLPEEKEPQIHGSTATVGRKSKVKFLVFGSVTTDQACLKRFYLRKGRAICDTAIVSGRNVFVVSSVHAPLSSRCFNAFLTP